MKSIIDCPVCDGKAMLLAERKKREYKDNEFEISEHYYKCDKCNYSFTNAQVDDYNTKLVVNKYKEKYKIPSPEQLKDIRELYGFSQTKMSEILGFGSNQYRLYESGVFPVGGNATVLSLIIDPAEFKNILVKKENLLSRSQIENTLNNIDRILNKDYFKLLTNFFFPKNLIPGSFAGFKLPSFLKFSNMVLYFLDEAPFKTKLNKLLFYADFAYFKYYGQSISGCRYAAIDMGPVPDQYSLIYGLVERKEFIATGVYKNKKGEFDKFYPLKPFVKDLFHPSEIQILDLVISTFKGCDTNAIIDISHKESAWIENESSKATIDYSLYAPQLKAV